MKKLPIGIQTFSEIREENYIYVDKTDHIFDLIESGKYYFLSRPRRFGKSLLISTLQAVFEGRQELFEGLYIHDKWDWSKKYPVIKISFAGVARNIRDMKQDVTDILRSNRERLNIKCEDNDNIGGCFRDLIKKSYEEYQEKVVILVDEYDKLILDNLDQMEALTLGHRIGIMNDGELVQIDTPQMIYKQPVNAFIAGFIGSANFFTGKTIGNQRVDLGFTILERQHVAEYGDGCNGLTENSSVEILVRPEQFIVADQEEGFAVKIQGFEFLGDRFRVLGKTDNGVDLLVDLPNTKHIETTKHIQLSFAKNSVFVN